MLADQKCTPQTGAPMSYDDVQHTLAELSGWHINQGALEKSYAFHDYHRTMAFVNAVAWIAHSQDHHPDLAVSFGKCVVRFSTHSVKGLSINDFICAAKVDGLFA